MRFELNWVGFYVSDSTHWATRSWERKWVQDHQTCTNSPVLRVIIHSDSRPQLSIQLNSILYSSMGQIITILNSLHFVSEGQNSILDSFIVSINKCRFNSWIHCMMNISAGVVLRCSLYPLIYLKEKLRKHQRAILTPASLWSPQPIASKDCRRIQKFNQRIDTCCFSNNS